MDYKALHICYICQKREDLQMIDEGTGRFWTALDFKSKDADPAMGEISPIEFMIGMIVKGRMIHLGYMGIMGKEVDNLKGIFHLPLYTQGKGLRSLKEHKSRKRRQGSSQVAENDSPNISNKAAAPTSRVKLRP